MVSYGIPFISWYRYFFDLSITKILNGRKVTDYGNGEYGIEVGSDELFP